MTRGSKRQGLDFCKLRSLTLSLFLIVCHYKLENISKRSFAGVGPQEPYDGREDPGTGTTPLPGGIRRGFRGVSNLYIYPGTPPPSLKGQTLNNITELDLSLPWYLCVNLCDITG